MGTVNEFLQYTLNKTCSYISSICEIYEMASKGKSESLLDDIVYENVYTFIELLRYPACNFVIKTKLPGLLANGASEGRVYSASESITECLLFAAKLLNGAEIKKHHVEKQFKSFLSALPQNEAGYGTLGKGMIRLILTILSFALEDTGINRSDKSKFIVSLIISTNI